MTHDLQPDDRLGDFTADSRVLTLTGMAALIGVISAFVALALLRLIGFFTHLFYYHAIDSRLVSPADNRLGVWALLVPIVGGLIVGLMARYGSQQIRGHGIPEALEAILIGQSRMSARVAMLKPLSSAISIGTGGPFGAEGPIIMTGGALGSLFGQAFHLSPAERKTLLVAAPRVGWPRCSARRWPRRCSLWSCSCSSGSRAASSPWPAPRRSRARCACPCSARDPSFRCRHTPR